MKFSSKKKNTEWRSKHIVSI